MPSIMNLFGYKIYFWSNENEPLEPVHVHVSKNPHKNATKIWICEDGPCIIANNNDQISGKDLKKLLMQLMIFQKTLYKNGKIILVKLLLLMISKEMIFDFYKKSFGSFFLYTFVIILYIYKYEIVII